MFLVYLLYGMALIAMALAIVIVNDYESQLPFKRILIFLAGFGFLHGAYQWAELWIMAHGRNLLLDIGQPLLLLMSFLFLFEFGRQMTLAAFPAGR